MIMTLSYPRFLKRTKLLYDIYGRLSIVFTRARNHINIQLLSRKEETAKHVLFYHCISRKPTINQDRYDNSQPAERAQPKQRPKCHWVPELVSCTYSLLIWCQRTWDVSQMSGCRFLLRSSEFVSGQETGKNTLIFSVTNQLRRLQLNGVVLSFLMTTIILTNVENESC